MRHCFFIQLFVRVLSIFVFVFLLRTRTVKRNIHLVVFREPDSRESRGLAVSIQLKQTSENFEKTRSREKARDEFVISYLKRRHVNTEPSLFFYPGLKDHRDF